MQRHLLAYFKDTKPSLHSPFHFADWQGVLKFLLTPGGGYLDTEIRLAFLVELGNIATHLFCIAKLGNLVMRKKLNLSCVANYKKRVCRRQNLRSGSGDDLETFY